MSKKNFIALADAIRNHNKTYPANQFTVGQISVLGDFCQAQNSQFNRYRWESYIRGECGPNGGQIK